MLIKLLDIYNKNHTYYNWYNLDGKTDLLFKKCFVFKNFASFKKKSEDPIIFWYDAHGVKNKMSIKDKRLLLEFFNSIQVNDQSELSPLKINTFDIRSFMSVDTKIHSLDYKEVLIETKHFLNDHGLNNKKKYEQIMINYRKSLFALREFLLVYLPVEKRDKLLILFDKNYEKLYIGKRVPNDSGFFKNTKRSANKLYVNKTPKVYKDIEGKGINHAYHNFDLAGGFNIQAPVIEIDKDQLFNNIFYQYINSFEKLSSDVIYNAFLSALKTKKMDINKTEMPEKTKKNCIMM